MSKNEQITDGALEAVKPEPVKGTWQYAIHEAGVLFTRADNATKRASTLLWTGAKEAIEDWDFTTDESGEGLYNEVKSLLGESRKGDASKIRTVALAVQNTALDLDAVHVETGKPLYPSLSSAYSEAVARTKTAAQHADEDAAADARTQAIAADAPKSSSKPEGAVLIVLAGGLDEASRLIVDSLSGEGPQADLSASRAMLRALSQEIAGRVPKPEPKVKAEPKAKGEAKVASDKPKPAKRAAAKGASKPKPAKKAGVVASGADVIGEENMPADEAEANVVSTPAVPVQRSKPKPVVRRGPKPVAQPA